jgi:hypothetical protein
VGKILYDAYLEIDLDDRVLAHLQLVMSIKLRRREGFFFSWQKPAGSGEGHSAVWIDASIPLHFIYLGSRMPSINREWLEALRISSNSGAGLQVLAEDAPLGSIAVTDSGTHFRRPVSAETAVLRPEPVFEG